MSHEPTKAIHSPASWARFLLTAILGLALDQWSKIHSFATLVVGKSVDETGHLRVSSTDFKVIPGYLHFYVTLNYGAVFGLGQGKRILFVAVSLAAIVFVIYLFAASGRQRLYQIILGMLVAGVLGNLYDRVALGYVRDMIYALPKSQLFPWIFNVADTLLCTGVGLMILHSFLHAPPRPAGRGFQVGEQA